LSVSGFVIFLLGVPISFKSKQQKSVALSSSAAEYVALSEAAKEIKVVYQILISMGFKVKTPIVVRVDNVRAMFMSENMSTGQRFVIYFYYDNHKYCDIFICLTIIFQIFQIYDIYLFSQLITRDAMISTIHCIKLSNGNLQIGVHIADVTYYVEAGSPLDIEASNRSTSTHLVARRLDVLPSLLTTDRCSLKGNVAANTVD